MTIAFGLTLAAILGAIVWIDFRRMIIPDALNFALAAAGLAYQGLTTPDALWLHAAAGAGLFAVFWLVRRVHAAATGRIGLGLGDVKMAGASAIWIGPWNLPLFVFLSSFVALVFALGSQLRDGKSPATARRPFGPFLAAGLLLTFVGEQQFSYLRGL